MLGLIGQISRRKLVATVILLVMGIGACGGASQESTPTESTGERVSPVVSSISLGGPQKVEDRGAAIDAWSSLTVGLDPSKFVMPFESDGSLYGIVESSQLDTSESADRYSLMKWTGSSWMPVSTSNGYDCYEYADCSLDIVGAGEVDFPIIVISWCCPMGAYAYRTDAMTSVFVVRDDSLAPLLSEDQNQFWAGEITPGYFEVESCSSGTVRFIEEYGYEDFYCYRAEVSRFYLLDGFVHENDVSSYAIGDHPFEACIVDTPSGCATDLFVYTQDCALEEIIQIDKFPISRCGYGYWVLSFEREIYAQGFAVDVDGFLLPSDVRIIENAQALAGLSPDGRIGPDTWRRFVRNAECWPVSRIGGPPNNRVSCEYDSNGDGLYGPGDFIPD